MIKRTLFFGNPAYLSTRNEQLVVNFPDKEKKEATIPIEDLGYVVNPYEPGLSSGLFFCTQRIPNLKRGTKTLQ